jgi:sigma-B regulation protein RsbU (phosphoserine phosphatase)
VSDSGEAKFLNAPGMPVGIKADQVEFGKAIEAAEITLAENDFLLIYTDGVTEGRGRHKNAYGTDRIVDILNENGDESAVEIARLIEADIIRFIGKVDQHDDITMVILKNCPEIGNDEDKARRTKSGVADHISEISSLTLRPDHNESNPD